MGNEPVGELKDTMSQLITQITDILQTPPKQEANISSLLTEESNDSNDNSPKESNMLIRTREICVDDDAPAEKCSKTETNPTIVYSAIEKDVSDKSAQGLMSPAKEATSPKVKGVDAVVKKDLEVETDLLCHCNIL